MLQILEATQAAYGYLPVAALKRISQRTGAWYAMIYGTATLLQPPPLRAARRRRVQAAGVDAHRPSEATYLTALDAALAGPRGAARRPPTRSGRTGTPGSRRARDA